MTANNHHIQIAFFFVFNHVYTHTDNCCSWKKKNKTRGRPRDEVPNPVLFKLEEEQQDDSWPKTKESSCSPSHVDILN
jgi:hypothetical protein